MPNRAVFLDRDGVLNRESSDFIKSVDEMEVLPGVPEAVAKLNDANYLAIVITNQSGIGRGYFSEDILAQMHAKLIAAINEKGGRIAAIYHCPHLPDAGCDCRKPAPGMLMRAAREHEIDLSRSYLVGDRPEDINCGAAVGCRTILVLTGKSVSYHPGRFTIPPDEVSADLTAAVEHITRSQ